MRFLICSATSRFYKFSFGIFLSYELGISGENIPQIKVVLVPQDYINDKQFVNLVKHHFRTYISSVKSRHAHKKFFVEKLPLHIHIKISKLGLVSY